MQTKRFYIRSLPCLVLVLVLLLSTFSNAKPVALEESQGTALTNGKPLPEETLHLNSKRYDDIFTVDGGSVDCRKNGQHQLWMDESRTILMSLPRSIYYLLRKLENSPYGSLRPYTEDEIAEFPSLALTTFDMFRNLFSGLPEEEVAALKKKYFDAKKLLLTFEDGFFHDYVVDTLKALTQQPSSSQRDVISFQDHTASMMRHQNVLQLRYFDLISYFTDEDLAMLKDSEIRNNFLEVLRMGKQVISAFVDLQVYQAASEVCDSLPHPNMDYADDTDNSPQIEPEKRTPIGLKKGKRR